RSAPLHFGDRHLSRVATTRTAHTVASCHGVSRLADRGSADGRHRDVAADPQGTQARRSLTAPVHPAVRQFITKVAATAPPPLPSRVLNSGMSSMIDQGYLRQPTVQGNTIVFVCDDD